MKDPVSRVTTDGRTARWVEHRAARREELIDYAVAAIARYGSQVGMDQIASAAGTSKPVMYRYFSDKDELYRAVGGRVVAQIVDALQAVHAGSETDPGLMLRSAIDGYVSLLDENPNLFRFVVQSPLGQPPDRHAEGEDPVTAILSRALGDQLRAAGLDPSAAQPWGVAAVGFIRAASLWWLDHPGAMTRRQLTDYLAALLWGGAAGVFQAAGVDVDARPRSGVFPVLPPVGS